VEQQWLIAEDKKLIEREPAGAAICGTNVERRSILVPISSILVSMNALSPTEQKPHSAK
jgi:hypothetical protein